MLLKCIILLKNHSFNIQIYGTGMYFSTSLKITLFFLHPSQLFAYLDFCVLRNFFKSTLFFNNLPPDPVKLVWEGSGNQLIK